MADVYMPKKKQSGLDLGKIATIGGAAFGLMNPVALGASAGAGLAGAAAGANLGGMAGGLLSSAPKQGPQAVAGGAINRRMQQLDQTPLRSIRDSIDSLKYIQDPAQRAELAMPLMKADYMARKA
jgi:hypothetical protein